MLTYQTGGSRESHCPSDPTKPLISIIIVTLNAEVHLRNCLRSISDQDYDNLEIIIFDGRSTDSTMAIIQEHEKQITYWQSTPDEGIFDAMNKATKIAKGDYLYFLGADDRLLPGFSRMCSELIDLSCIYYGDMSYNGETTSRKAYSSYRIAKETICHQAIFYPKAVFNFYSYNQRYRLAADWVLNLQLWSDARFKFQFFPFVIADFSLTGASSLAKDKNFLQDQAQLIRKYLGILVYIRFCIKKLRSRQF